MKATVSKARDYKPTTLKRLYLLSGNQCAEPKCTKKLLANDGITIVSKICHIEAAGSLGSRYNPNMTDDERRDFPNLILLCDECHSIVDNKVNESQYPVPILKQWKKDHEGKVLEKLTSNPSLLVNAINAISGLALKDTSTPEAESLSPFVIEEKISYNSIVRNKYLIDEYKIYYTKINSLYQELENEGIFKKENLLRYIRNLYLKIKGRYVKDSNNVQEVVSANSDNIIDDIQNELSESIVKEDSIHKEDIEFGITIIMVDSFMRCKILEQPA